MNNMMFLYGGVFFIYYNDFGLLRWVKVFFRSCKCRVDSLVPLPLYSIKIKNSRKAITHATDSISI